MMRSSFILPAVAALGGVLDMPTVEIGNPTPINSNLKKHFLSHSSTLTKQDVKI